MFEGEALGLGAMYETRSIRVPKPFKVHNINFVYIPNCCLFQLKPIIWQYSLSEPVAKHCRLDPFLRVVPTLSWNSLNLVLPEEIRWDWNCEYGVGGNNLYLNFNHLLILSLF